MMCEYSKLLIRYLDGQCNKFQEKEIKEHLLSCKDCLEEQQSYYALKTKLERAKQVKAPKELADMVFSRLNEEHRAFGKVDLWIEKRSKAERAVLALGLTVVFLAGFQLLTGLSQAAPYYKYLSSFQSNINQGAHYLSVLPHKIITCL